MTLSLTLVFYVLPIVVLLKRKKKKKSSIPLFVLFSSFCYSRPGIYKRERTRFLGMVGRDSGSSSNHPNCC